MEIGLHFIGYLLAFFFAFLYFPYLAFKTGAEYTVDLGRRRDSGEIEQFFAAIIPAGLLNLLTGCWAWFGRAVGACPWRAHLDYNVIAAVVSGDEKSIRSFITSDERHKLMFIYLAALMLVSSFSGILYGYAFKRLTARPEARSRIPSRRRDVKGWEKGVHVAIWFLRCLLWLMLEIVSLFSYRLWHPLFHEEVISFFPWSVQKPWVFIRMHNDRLYYGQFIRYDKSTTGDIESLTIGDVRRYCYDEVDQCLAAGRLPISSFQGSLRIMTREIADIHNVPENHFVHVQERYRNEMIRRLGRDLLTAFAEQKRITVHEIFIQHGGGTALSRYRYRLALRKLEDLRFITIEPSTYGLEGSEVPADEAVVTFPKRVASAYDGFTRASAASETFPHASAPISGSGGAIRVGTDL